jgi:hypothetical protein
MSETQDHAAMVAHAIAELVDSLIDQQAMPDDSWRPKLVRIQEAIAALAETRPRKAVWPTRAQVEAHFTAMRAGQPLWRCISACRERARVTGRTSECAACQVDRLEAAVLALYAEPSQSET